MSRSCNFSVLLKKVGLWSIGALLYSQSAIPGQWVGGSYLFTYPHIDIMHKFSVLIDEKNNITKTMPNIADAEDFPAPLEYRRRSSGSFWYNDAFYTLAYGLMPKGEDGIELIRWTFAKWQDEAWEYLGHYITEFPNFIGS